MVSTTFTPEWKKFEDKIRSDNPEEARTAADRFEITRATEMKNDPRARKWEQSRKESFAKNKPEWVKQRIKNENREEELLINKFKDGGHMTGDLHPAPGLLVIKKEEEQQIVGGLILPDNAEYESNMARVVHVGKSMNLHGLQVESPCAVGEKVLFRKGAGLNIKINNEPHLIIRFDEVFGVIEE